MFSTVIFNTHSINFGRRTAIYLHSSVDVSVFQLKEYPRYVPTLFLVGVNDIVECDAFALPLLFAYQLYGIRYNETTATIFSSRFRNMSCMHWETQIAFHRKDCNRMKSVVRKLGWTNFIKTTLMTYDFRITG